MQRRLAQSVLYQRERETDDLRGMEDRLECGAS
jgi:hypothetical protein